MSYYQYYEVMKNMQPFNKVKIRFEMVKHAKKKSITDAARIFNTSRPTVYKWLKRYDKYGIGGLYNNSRAPERVHNKTPKHIEDIVVDKRNQLGKISTRVLVRDFGVPVSHETARRILHERKDDLDEGKELKSKKKKKKETRKKMAEIKQKWNAFTQIDIDVKHLDDIPFYYPFMKALGLPKYQYSARCVSSGVYFTAYSQSISLGHSCIFGRLLCEFLRENGIDLTKVRFQYDNGSEFIGAINAKNYSKFEKMLMSYGADINRIPIGQWSWNADVETVHAIIEREFFDIEVFNSKEHFFHKINNYMFFFNTKRRNSNKKDKTPLEILIEKKKNPELVNWFVPDLDKLLSKKMDLTLEPGLDLASLKNNFNIISQSVNHVPWNLSIQP
jgi:transposase